MNQNLVRTTSFRLAESSFGSVFAYRAGERFRSAWELLERRWKASNRGQHERRVPYRSLAIALRVLTGDFVAFQRRTDEKSYFLLSRKAIKPEHLEMVLAAWELAVLGEPRAGAVSSVVDTFEESRIEVASLIHRREGRCPQVDGGRWPWEVAIWEVAHRLARETMRTDGKRVRWRVDSDAALLTWDHLLPPQEGKVQAMHRIVPHLVTIPGIEEPVVHLQSSLVRLRNEWQYARNAWALVAADMPILRASVRRLRLETGNYQTVWADGAGELLRRVVLDGLPSLEAPPRPAGQVRTGFRYPPRFCEVGKGVGTWFHEILAHHAREVLGRDAEPLELVRRPGVWPSRSRLARRVPGFATGKADRVRFVCLYATSEVRRRMRDALGDVFQEGVPRGEAARMRKLRKAIHQAPDGRLVKQGGVEVIFSSPPDAGSWLLERKPAREISTWLDGWLDSVLEGRPATVAALLETNEGLRGDDEELRDPKHVLRRCLAQRGVVSQFITRESEPGTRAVRTRKPRRSDTKDHPARNAVWDLFRSAGVFPRAFPAAAVAPGTLLVGAYAAQARYNGVSRYLVNVVAAVAGGTAAYGYVRGRGWHPLGEATAQYLGGDPQYEEREARGVMEQALAELRVRHEGKPIVLFIDGCGSRQLWPCLADKSDLVPEPWMTRGGTAVVRVRSAFDEVPRAAGVGPWTKQFKPARYTDFRVVGVTGANGSAPAFLLSGSAVMDRGRQARAASRFAADKRSLREDWHALGTTELLVMDPGGHAQEALVRLTALLCRLAPTWDRGLRWPSVLHLARAVVRDHPSRSQRDDEDDEDADGDGEIRLDF